MEAPHSVTFDETWKQKAVDGDPVAVRRLAREAMKPLYAFCLYRLNRDHSLCEEVVQETLLRGIQDLAKYDPTRSRGSVFAWLTGLARNEIKKVRRRAGQSVSLDQLWARMDRELLDVYAKLGSELVGSEVLEREETRTMVNATMSQLPPHYREALEAKYLKGTSVRDIARALGLTEKAVESQLVRARKAFRATFTALARNLGVEPAL